jgi:putative ABC transport system permease protein
MPMVALYENNSGNPIPDISDNIYRVSIDNWKSDEPFHSRFPDMPTEILNARDTKALSASDIPSDYTASYTLNVWVRSTDDQSRTKPFHGSVRVTNNGFFRMLDVPMAYGSYWRDDPAKDRSNVAVISRMTNARLFGGGDSVGKNFKLANETYTVIGVVADWAPTAKKLGTATRFQKQQIRFSNRLAQSFAFTTRYSATISRFRYRRRAILTRLPVQPAEPVAWRACHIPPAEYLKMN